jgi:hypothetical protein
MRRIGRQNLVWLAEGLVSAMSRDGTRFLVLDGSPGAAATRALVESTAGGPQMSGGRSSFGSDRGMAVHAILGYGVGLPGDPSFCSISAAFLFPAFFSNALR